MNHDQDTIAIELATHAILRLIADRPGTAGRLRTARIATGRPVPAPGTEQTTDLSPYGVAAELPLKDVVALIDALAEAHLITATVGRPLLVLTRAGHRALDALEASSGGAIHEGLHERIVADDHRRLSPRRTELSCP